MLKLNESHNILVKNQKVTTSAALAWLGLGIFNHMDILRVVCSKCLVSKYDPSALGVTNLHK